jgi:hypothetical protein
VKETERLLGHEFAGLYMPVFGVGGIDWGCDGTSQRRSGVGRRRKYRREWGVDEEGER